jgi:hypothetical protein
MNDAASAAPEHAAFDRAAATILGTMITLIAGLSLVLVDMSVGAYPEQLPVAATVAETAVSP